MPDDADAPHLGATLTESDEVSVLFLRVRDDVVEMGLARERLEALVGLRGRRASPPG